jgi:hypothetical protein
VACRHQQPVGPGLWTARALLYFAYSPECVEGGFSEVHIIQRRTHLAPNSHPRRATSAADGPLHSRRPPKERTDLCDQRQRTRPVRLIIKAAILVCTKSVFRDTMCDMIRTFGPRCVTVAKVGIRVLRPPPVVLVEDSDSSLPREETRGKGKVRLWPSFSGQDRQRRRRE